MSPESLRTPLRRPRPQRRRDPRPSLGASWCGRNVDAAHPTRQSRKGGWP